MSKEYDFTKMINTDDVIDVEEKIQGVIVLLQGLSFAEKAGSHAYQGRSYDALNIILSDALDGLENVKSGINYMQDLIEC